MTEFRFHAKKSGLCCYVFEILKFGSTEHAFSSGNPDRQQPYSHHAVALNLGSLMAKISELQKQGKHRALLSKLPVTIFGDISLGTLVLHTSAGIKGALKVFLLVLA